MADEQVNVELNILLTPEAQERVKKGLSTLAEEMQKELQLQQDIFGADPQKYNRALSQITSGFKKVGRESKVTAEQAGKNWDKFWVNYEKAAQRATITVLREQGRILILSSRSLKYVSDAVGQISRGILATGTALTAGVFGLAGKYIKDAKESTETTRQWRKATEDLKKSQMEIGAVFAQGALPYLQKAAQLAREASRFVQDNPDIVKAAINTGLVLVTLGTVGTLLSRGIKLVADITYVAGAASNIKASQIQLEASLNQLAAAGMQAKASGLKVGGGLLAGTGITAAVLTSIVGTVVAIMSGGAIGAALYDAAVRRQREHPESGGRLGGTSGEVLTGGAYLLGKNVFGRIAGLDEKEADRKATVLAALIGKLTGAIDESSPLWLRAAASVKRASDALEQASDQLRGSPVEAEVVQAYIQYRNKLADLERETGDKRVEIVRKAADAMLKANQDNASAIARIWADFNSRIAEITSSYQLATQRAYEDYLHERENLEQEQGEREIEIRKRLQKRLRELEQEHSDRMYDLVAARDALGIVRENRDYERKKQEAREEAEEELKKLREETRKRLEELDYRYQLEQTRRQEDYERQLAEAAKARDEQLQEQQKKHEEELKQIKEQKEKELRELEIGYRNQQDAIRQAFIDQVNDLDTHLTGETNLRKQYYALMLQDAETFLENYRKQFQNPFNPPIPPYAAGGYATGVVRTGEQGMEYIVNARTTKALEGLIGGRLTQQGILNAVVMGRAGNITWNDQRRFSGEYTAALRRQVKKDSQEAIGAIFERAFG